MRNKEIVSLLFVWVILLPVSSGAQEEVASRYYHYRSTEMATGLYEEYEVRPRNQTAFFQAGERQGIGLSRVEEQETRAWNRLFLSDAHVGLSFYEQRRCVDCHPDNANNRHTIRHGITCRQCHGEEPIASIRHYYSRLNPIRQHTHVCARCHEGAGASFALYRVHEPNPAQRSTLRAMPLLFYTFWIMVALAVGTFALFLPHTVMWGIRELFIKKEKGKGGVS
jgi:hypothetical protein